MPTRVIIAYALIVLIAAVCVAVYLYATRERRADRKALRAHQRSKQQGSSPDMEKRPGIEP